MTKILNHINTYADLTAYNADLNKDFPNVSYIQGSDEVKWNKYDPEYIVCKYNVTSTSEATKLLYSNSGITYQIIDGVKQDTVQLNYTFDTLGEHTVKYVATTINRDNFYQCTNLTSVTIPNSVTTIGNSVFKYCSNLVSIILGDNITSLGERVFEECTNLTSITIPSGVTSIGDSFLDNASSPSINFLSTTPTPSINFNNWENIIYVPAESLETYKAAQKWSTYAGRIFPYPQQKGAEITFKMARNATNTNIFGNRQYQYFQNVFVNGVLQPSSKTITANTNDIVRCTLYDERMIPQFFNAYKDGNGYIKEIILPSTIKSIPTETLYYTTNMVSVTILATTPPTIGSRVLSDTNNCPIYVPAESVDAYKAASVWSSLASRIQAIPNS